jgi:tyrosyl-tRNA synthetase
MSASDEKSKISVHDSDKQIREKVEAAYCPAGAVEDNGVLEYVKHLVFPILREQDAVFSVERGEEYGGDVTYNTYAALEEDFVSGALHPADLKQAAARHVAEVVAPVREACEEIGDVMQQAYPDAF